MIRGPPRLPTTSSNEPSRSRTIVGDIALSMRLPGWIAFASPCTSPNMFGLPGCAAKSSISSLRKNPAALTYTPEPKSALSVVVVATALPAASTTE